MSKKSIIKSVRDISGMVVVVLLVLVVIWVSSFYKAKQKELLNKLNDKEVEMVQEIGIRDEQLLAKEKQLIEINSRLIEFGKQLDSLEVDRDNWKEEAKVWEQKAKEASPESLVADVRDILGTDEVWVMDDGICFSINAFRLVSEKLYDWKDFYQNREPNYLETIKVYEIKCFVLNEKINLKDEQIQDLKDIRVLQEEWNKEMKEYIISRNKNDLWSTMKQVGTGIGIGVLCVLILK